MSNKKLFKIILILSSISLITTFFIGTFSGLFLNTGYYDELYEKTGVYNRIDKELVDEKTAELFGFFQEKNELDTSFYTEDEISHMKDVNGLIKKAFIVYYTSLMFLLALSIFVYLYFKESFSLFFQKTLFYSGVTTVLIVVLFFLFSFTSLFSMFHKIFFTGNYTFSLTSNLIKLFNQEFFYLFAKKIFATSLFKGIISTSISFLFYSSNKSKKS